MKKQTNTNWNAQDIIDWLFETGRFLENMDAVIQALGDRMLEEGAPVRRLLMAMRTLHPLIAAVSLDWERETDSVKSTGWQHGLENRTDYHGSPLEIVGRTRALYRKNLQADLKESDHATLHELKARGVTDYLGLSMPFSNGSHAILVFNTDVAGGFSQSDIRKMKRIAAAAAPIIEVQAARQITNAVAEAYLGKRTGQRVLGGQITRGDIDTITAAILFSDMRGWTRLNSDRPAPQVVELANRYFECVADAVEQQGGEVLKFIGDGVLAIFEAGDAENGEQDACDRALQAARAALQQAGATDLDVEFGAGLHFGEVQYGNVGSATRLDFTVLGQAVNIAARIESACRDMDQRILFSEVFSNRLSAPAELLDRLNLKGVDGRVAVFAPG